MISFISIPCGAGLPMLGLGCATNPCRDLFLRPFFVSAERLRNAPFCALGTAPCGFFNTWMPSTACRRSAEKVWSTGPPACHAISKRTSPVSTAAFLCLRVAAPKFYVHPPGVPKGSPTGYIRPSYTKTIHLRRGCAMCHICFTTGRTLVYGAFCVLLSCAVHVRLNAMGNKLENAPPPLPIVRPHPRAPPPLDHSVLCVTFSLYLCPFGAYLFLIVHVSLDKKGNECIASETSVHGASPTHRALFCFQPPP